MGEGAAAESPSSAIHCNVPRCNAQATSPSLFPNLSTPCFSPDLPIFLPFSSSFSHPFCLAPPKDLPKSPTVVPLTALDASQVADPKPISPLQWFPGGPRDSQGGPGPLRASRRQGWALSLRSTSAKVLSTPAGSDTTALMREGEAKGREGERGA